MKPLRFVLIGMAVLAVSATFVAAQNGGIGRTIDAIGSVITKLVVQADRAADPGDATARRGQSATDFRWSGRVAPGEALEIKGINGAITVGPASGDEVVVTAEARGRRSDPSTVRIERVEHAGGLTFCAVYPTPDGERENYCGPGSEGRMNTRDIDVTVEFHIELPAGVDFIGRTVNGDIEASQLESDVFANTVNGDVELSTTGFAEAETVNGSIEATMASPDLRDGATFSTVNGSITLDLDDDVDADLDASWLNGGFDAELPVAVSGRATRRSVRGQLGDGGPKLELSTVNGSIRIR